MGMLVDGIWQTEDHFPTDGSGEFVRKPTTCRARVSADGRHLPEAGRYHLYVSYACPWAHRALIVRALRGLEETIGVTSVDPLMEQDGWQFSEGPGCGPDPILGARLLREVYVASDPRFTGRVTVPILWDKRLATIVNNESTDIIRMLNDGFGAPLARRPEIDLWPEPLREASDAMRERIYHRFNNGVYRAGFARSQEAYERAVADVFAALDELEATLAAQRYLCSDAQIVEADVCAFTTLLRFDPVYVGHFKCNVRRIADYPALSGYLRDLYQTDGIAPTCRMDHIKGHYYRSHTSLNPTGIVPTGPLLDLDAPHGRG